MNTRTTISIAGTVLCVLAAGTGCSRSGQSEHPARAEYDALVNRLGGDERAVRDELNELISSNSAPLDSADQSRVNALTRECLDPRVLLDIEHMRLFVTSASLGEAPPFHFVGGDRKARLQALAGEKPSSDRVLELRKALARLAADFDVIRQPPDWKIEVTEIKGEPPRLAFLDLLRDGSQFLPYSLHPELRESPIVPTFAGVDAELLAQLEQFFNGAKARAAFPPDKFPKLYVNGRIPPIPTALEHYRADISNQIGAEMMILTPEENPDPEKVKSINETYLDLGRFLEAVSEFGK